MNAIAPEQILDLSQDFLLNLTLMWLTMAGLPWKKDNGMVKQADIDSKFGLQNLTWNFLGCIIPIWHFGGQILLTQAIFNLNI